jgi:hypothetical protein
MLCYPISINAFHIMEYLEKVQDNNYLNNKLKKCINKIEL